MNGTLNKVMLIGHLGDDVKMHQFDDANSIGRFPVATTESFTSKETGEKVSQPRVINQPDPRIPGTTFWAWIISDLFFLCVLFELLQAFAGARKKSATHSVHPVFNERR